jgi:hypothetical protein
VKRDRAHAVLSQSLPLLRSWCQDDRLTITLHKNWKPKGTRYGWTVNSHRSDSDYSILDVLCDDGRFFMASQRRGSDGYYSTERHPPKFTSGTHDRVCGGWDSIMNLQPGTGVPTWFVYQNFIRGHLRRRGCPDLPDVSDDGIEGRLHPRRLPSLG